MFFWNFAMLMEKYRKRNKNDKQGLINTFEKIITFISPENCFSDHNDSYKTIDYHKFSNLDG